MKKSSIAITLLTGSLALTCPLYADDNHHDNKVVPDAERDIALQRNISGPTENKGIGTITLLGTVELGDEFPTTAGRQLRARKLIILPGGIVAVHQHDARPGMAYILEGEIVEHRNDQPEPIVRKPGAVAFEKTGVVHWWENQSSAPVKALVVDIIKPEQK